ncbi:N-acetyllactosaminide beta-1,3-N-acetylglucosaminyltransferase 3 [Perognathus longimembris pacificus]|uniref:N-acetyllactosaminide beta-1,3-N-acetylglucosaminyltransferase 3 n=1 Tax=Perognathus longimembris pacificus TaxID=214514 RepID=UPI0020198018|nr:N-acetyllactosaminide beta-1,3-N-acetylglucosaminyltransferase 3 [Perognathus longimembris pacificus]
MLAALWRLRSHQVPPASVAPHTWVLARGWEDERLGCSYRSLRSGDAAWTPGPRPDAVPPAAEAGLDLPLALALGACVLLAIVYLRPAPRCTAPEEAPGTRAALAQPPLAPRPPPCTPNTSIAQHPDFAAQPVHVRDFLLYRHCRDFALLQDAAADKCSGPVFLLLAIKSSPRNYERRQLVRQTWGLERQVRGAPIRRLFLVGTASDPHQAHKLNRLLELEAQTHGDILQWDFHDSFFNLTLKQVLFLRWQETRCTNASFVLNGDDDVFAHTDNMVAYLQGQDPDRHLFVGHLIQNVGPIRVPWSKYFVPRLLTAAERYPPYCGGGGLLLSRFTGRALRRAAPALLLFPIDDVFLGMCLQHEGLRPAAHSGVRTAGVHAPSPHLSSFDPCFYRELLLVHRFLPYEMLLMWDALNRPDMACGRRAKIY